jgi:hypothetical protein
MAADTIANAPSVVLGTAGAIAGAPSGPLGAAALATAGAAGGKLVSQGIAKAVFDEPQTRESTVSGMMREGAVTGAFTLVGSALSAALSRMGLARDAGKVDRAAADALRKKGESIGVDLNVPQTTNLPSLKADYELLARHPASMDRIAADRLRVGQQAAGAVDRFTAGISPTAGSPSLVGENVRGAAKGILDKISGERAAAAKPFYDNALKTSLDALPLEAKNELAKIQNNPAFEKALERGRRLARIEEIDIGSGNNMLGLHYAKLGLDAEIGSGFTQGMAASEKKALVGLKNRLLDVMDAASTDYADARRIFGHFTPAVQESRKGFLGQLANLADLDLNTAAKRIFDPSNAATDVRALRETFIRYGKSNEWNQLLSSYLQDTFEAAGREFRTSGGVVAQAPTWRAMMAGNPKQLANIRASMTQAQVAGFNDMMDVFEAIGRVSGQGGSQTFPLGIANSEMKARAQGVVPKILQPRETVINWLSEARMGDHAAEMARVMTSKDGINRLKEIRQMSVVDKRFWSGLSSLFGMGKSTDETPEDRPIPAR